MYNTFINKSCLLTAIYILTSIISGIFHSKFNVSLFCQVVKDLVTIFPVLRDWMAEFLGGNCQMTASEIGHNLLIEQVLFLSYTLFSLTIYNHNVLTIEYSILNVQRSLIRVRLSNAIPVVYSKSTELCLHQYLYFTFFIF